MRRYTKSALSGSVRMRIWDPRLKLTSVLIEVNSVVYEQDQCIGTMNDECAKTLLPLLGGEGRGEGGIAVRFMESLVSIFRMHWDPKVPLTPTLSPAAVERE